MSRVLASSVASRFFSPARRLTRLDEQRRVLWAPVPRRVCYVVCCMCRYNLYLVILALLYTKDESRRGRRASTLDVLRELRTAGRLARSVAFRSRLELQTKFLRFSSRRLLLKLRVVS